MLLCNSKGEPCREPGEFSELHYGRTNQPWHRFGVEQAKRAMEQVSKVYPGGRGKMRFPHLKLQLALWAGLASLTLFSNVAAGSVLWSHPGTVLVCDNGKGEDILHGAIKPWTTNSAGTLYFRVKVDPIADTAAKVIKGFEAGFILVEHGEEHLGIGNSSGAMAYTAMNVPKAAKGYEDLNSAVPDPPFTYEYMRAGRPRYLVLRVEFVPGEDARVSAWLNPDLSAGATEFNQPSNIVVHFQANATFDAFHLVHRGYGGGWKFSQMMVATSFEDLRLLRFWQQKWFLPVVLGGVLVLVGGTVQLVERRRTRWQIDRLEEERSVASERTRIARDIHDEVGAELAQIGLLADLGAGARGEAGRERFHQIANRARHLVTVMDEIVWAVNPQNDNLTQLADYLCQMADECLNDSPVRLAKEVPLQLPPFPIRAEVRHHLTLAVKEAFTNLLKHAQASQAQLRLSWNEPELVIIVEDNGCGFDPAVANSGNGLGNQQARMKKIGGTIELNSQPGRGTRIIFRVRFETPD
jgi:signal transduction histidine kinase